MRGLRTQLPTKRHMQIMINSLIHHFLIEFRDRNTLLRKILSNTQAENVLEFIARVGCIRPKCVCVCARVRQTPKCRKIMPKIVFAPRAHAAIYE